MPTAAILNQERERWARHQIKALSATDASLSGAVVKQTQIPLIAVSAAPSGSLVKKTLVAFAAGATAMSGAIVKRISVVLSSVGAAFNGSLVKKTLVVLAAAFAALSGSLIKKTLAILAAVVAAMSGSLVKKTLAVLSAKLSALNGALAGARTKVLALAASMTALSGGVVKKTSVFLSAISSALSGTQAKRTSRSLVATSSALSGNVNKLTKKFYNALLSAWNAVVSGVKTHPTPTPPTVFTPTAIAGALVSFGVSEIDTFSPQTQMFFGSVVPRPTANGWGDLGQRAMGAQLLVAPGNGGLSSREYYVVLGGDVTLPADTTGASLSISLSENYFQLSGQSIISSRDTLSTSIIPVTAGVTATWSAVIRLRGNGSQNGFLLADTLVGNTVVQSTGTNHNPNAEPQLQLSVGINLQGTSSQTPRVRLLQFEIQSTER